MKFAPPDAYLSVSYLEETILFHFILTECKLIAEIFKRFMDDGFGLWQIMLIMVYLERFLMN